MGAEWLRLCRSDDIVATDDAVEVLFDDGRRHRLRVEEQADLYQLSGFVVRQARVAALENLHLEAWLRNRSTTLIGFRVDERGRLVGEAWIPTHAVLVTEGGYEFETFFYPFNHDWEISYCEFTDSHDGVYPSGHHIKFHHNWIDRMNDDGIYLSSPSPYTSNKVHVYQNLITRTLSAFGLHGRGGPRGDIYVYRNIVDARQGILRLRPTMDKPEGDVSNCQVFLMHGGDGQLGVESIYWYQNTFLAPPNSYGYLHSTWMNTNETTRRRSFNNIHVYLNNWFNPRAVVNVAKGKIVAHDIVADGNLHWCTNLTATDPGNFLQETAKLEISESNKKNYAPGWDAYSLKADPLFIKSDAAPATMNDYGLQSGSPAIGAGIVLPPELDDPLRPQDGARPDIGAVPAGHKAAGVGRYGRVVPGSAIGIGENFAP